MAVGQGRGQTMALMMSGSALAPESSAGSSEMQQYSSSEEKVQTMALMMSGTRVKGRKQRQASPGQSAPPAQACSG